MVQNRTQLRGLEQVLEQMKYEIAQEFGIQIGADQISRLNGAVGGEMVKRLIQIAEVTITNQPSVLNRHDTMGIIQ